MRVLSICLVLVACLSWGCKDEDQSAIDRQIILDYLADNNLEAEEDMSGLFYIIDVPGSEEKPLLSDSVVVAYRGYLTDGNVFDATAENETVTLRLSRLIEGWRIGIPKFGRGGSGTLLIPSALGYGPNRLGVIPANAVLLFDIELEDFKPDLQPSIDRQIILDYLAANNLAAEEDESGLFFHIDEPGSAEKPSTNSNVTIAYRGYLTNGTVFDETEENEPATFQLNNLIEGWKIGIPKFGRGGSGQLFIPSALGYGENEVGIIPANSVLIFDIELQDF
ncbi:MAG: FKBP-type peptidyl-prolyl cis-trans isomerase [Bacteroidota bacterium]